MHAGVLDGPHPPGAPHAGLHLVGHQENPVTVTQGAQPRQPRGGRHDVPALALHRLDENRRDLRRRHLIAEQDIFQVGKRLLWIVRPRPGDRVHLAERVRGMQHPGHERPEALVVLGLGRGQRHRPVGPAVERPEEADHVRPPGGVPGELERPFDGLGPGVGEEHPDRAGHGRRRGERGAHPRVDWQVEVAGRVVQQLAGLRGHRRYYAGVAVPGGRHGDARVAVEEQVPVGVLDNRAEGPARHQGVGARQRPARDGEVPLDDRLPGRPGQRGLHVGNRP